MYKLVHGSHAYNLRHLIFAVFASAYAACELPSTPW